MYASVYKTFGDVQSKLYPKELPNYVPLDDMLDLGLLRTMQTQYKGKNIAPADAQKFAAGDEIRRNVSQRAWNIEFNSGQSTFTPAAQEELNQLFDDLVVAGSLKVAVHGHTDNTSDPQKNQAALPPLQPPNPARQPAGGGRAQAPARRSPGPRRKLFGAL